MSAAGRHHRARAWRKSLGLTRTGLGHALGISARTIAYMEAGARSPGMGEVSARDWLRYRRLCAGLAADPDFDFAPTAAAAISPGSGRPAKSASPQ
jgi:transcriptional regulator with XRE-family HTH domain